MLGRPKHIGSVDVFDILIASIVYFWDNVDVSDKNSCWSWLGYVAENGYGHCNLGKRDNGTKIRIGAHRASWMIANNTKVPDGLCVLHRCDNPICVNPDHLFIGTDKTNAEDRESKKRGGGIKCINSAKLKKHDIIDIRKSLSEGVNGSVIAKSYGVSPSAVSLVKKNLTWRHV